jgi:hypothetical protein
MPGECRLDAHGGCVVSEIGGASQGFAPRPIAIGQAVRVTPRRNARSLPQSLADAAKLDELAKSRLDRRVASQDAYELGLTGL